MHQMGVIFLILRENFFGKEQWAGEFHQMGLWDLRKENEDGDEQGIFMMTISSLFFSETYTSQPLSHLLISPGNS